MPPSVAAAVKREIDTGANGKPKEKNHLLSFVWLPTYVVLRGWKYKGLQEREEHLKHKIPCLVWQTDFFLPLVISCYLQFVKGNVLLTKSKIKINKKQTIFAMHAKIIIKKTR